MSDIKHWNAKFKYQLTQWLPREELDSVISHLQSKGSIEKLDYVIKKRGNTETFGIFTLGKEIKKGSKEVCRRGSGQINL